MSNRYNRACIIMVIYFYFLALGIYTHYKFTLNVQILWTPYIFKKFQMQKSEFHVNSFHLVRKSVSICL